MSAILSAEVQQFIRDHEDDDERELVLKHKTILGLPAPVIAEQISARRKARQKIPAFYRCADIIFPPGINLEQSSSEQTAQYKIALLTANLSSHSFATALDLTGGFGVDTFFLSERFAHVHYIEVDQHLYKTAVHNHRALGRMNIIHHHGSAVDFLKQSDNAKADLVFIDPSRRTTNKKVFTLAESEPDVTTLQSNIFERTDHLLIKASPLMDIKLAIKQLMFVKQVAVVAVENEVKELLFFCEKGFKNETVIEAVNLPRTGNPDVFSFLFSDEESMDVTFSDPKQFLYEPGASILKAGAFKSVAHKFGLSKVHPSTHLYTSEQEVTKFPGRIFKVEAISKPDKKTLRPFFPLGKANVITRNYPLTVDQLKKKTGLSDGGDKYLIGFSGVSEKFVAIAGRIK